MNFFKVKHCKLIFANYIPTSIRELPYQVYPSGTSASSQITVVAMNKTAKTNKVKVFVTYSWGDEKHNQRVMSFTNLLRLNGFDADVDRSISAQESAVNFEVMMTKNILSSHKVIIILSEEYKKKADNFQSGVGKEYQYILSTIDSEKTKYILVSFVKLVPENLNKVTPLGFKSREVVDLTVDEQNGFKKLFSKLRDSGTLKFDPVANSLPTVQPEEIPVFTLAEQPTKPNLGNHEIKQLLRDWSSRLANDSYFESYHTFIDCEYVVISKVLAIKKRVKSIIILSNPMDDFLEEANFFSIYKFAKIRGVKDESLLQLLRLEITIDDQPKKDLTAQIMIDTRSKNRIKAYKNTVTFQYKIISGGFASNINFPFKKRMVIELEEERIVPRNDLIYLKEFNKLTKDFRIEYSFPDLVKTLNGNFVSSLTDRAEITCKPSQNGNRFCLTNSGWFLPGDGVFIFVED